MPDLTEPSDELLDRIYDAAVEQELWPSVLAEIADLTNSQGGILIGQSILASQVYFDYNGRLDEDCNRAFRERHIQNPWSLGMVYQPIKRVVFSDEIIPLSALRTTAFFDEVLHPQNVAHNAMSALAAREDFIAAFNMCRSAEQGPFGDNERRLLELLVRHVHRSLVLGFRLDGYHALHSAEYNVLDRLSAGVILLDQRMKVIYANAAARAHGSDDGALRLNGHGVTTRSAPHSLRLAELIRAAQSGMPAGSMSVPRISDGRLLIVLALSVRGKDISRFTDANMPDAAVLLFVIDPANRAGIPVALIMDAYGLTQAEARVALAASSGKTVSETAIELGLSPNTVKTHLRKVFTKTDTNRQAELAGLMAAISLLRSNGAGRD